MTTNWKALCAELLAWTEKTSSHYYKQVDVLLRARAALAEQPVGEGPSESDLADLFYRHVGEGSEVGFENAIAEALARWGNPAPPHDPWKEVLLDALVCNFLLEKEHENDPKKALNDLIAWEKQLATDPLINPASQPVPVSERLPGPEDCDVQGRCWLWERDCGYSGCKWALVDRTWSLSQSDEDLSVYTHWLPFHALPLPEQEVSE